MKKLASKVAVVTGASKGIGASVARHLAAEGASVVVNYASDRAGAERTVAAIVAADGKAIAVGANLTREAEVTRLFDETRKAFGRVDILVNNAGIYAFDPLEQVTVEGYHRIHDTNVLGLLLTTRAALPLFPASGGSIINIGSGAVSLAPPTAAVYASSKAAVETITKVLAKELGPRQIRVNGVNPGTTATEGYSAAGFAGSDFERQILAQTPLGRVGQPDDIAPPVVFLASDDARWITGDILLVSGGVGM